MNLRFVLFSGSKYYTQIQLQYDIKTNKVLTTWSLNLFTFSDMELFETQSDKTFYIMYHQQKVRQTDLLYSYQCETIIGLKTFVQSYRSVGSKCLYGSSAISTPIKRPTVKNKIRGQSILEPKCLTVFRVRIKNTGVARSD